MPVASSTTTAVSRPGRPIRSRDTTSVVSTVATIRIAARVE
jgi:hypothetical protein